MIKIRYSNLEIVLDFINDITINYIKLINLLLYFNITKDDIENMVIYIDNNIITLLEYNIGNNHEDHLVIDIIIEDNLLLNEKILDIFNNLNITTHDKKNIIDIICNNNNNINNIIKETNEQTINLLNNKDFINLIHIYKRSPELFITLSKYTCTGDNICMHISRSNNDIKYRNMLIVQLKKLNIVTDTNMLEKMLEKYNNNLNLTIREILKL